MTRKNKTKRYMKKTYTCNFCGKEYKWEDNKNSPPHMRLENHKVTVHGIKPIRRSPSGYIRYEEDKENYQFIPCF